MLFMKYKQNFTKKEAGPRLQFFLPLEQGEVRESAFKF